METKSKEMFWFLKGILSALLISAMGFGVLFVLYINWASLYPNSTLPGLFEFKAASIGDSILLPIIIGSFVFYNRKLNLDIKNKILRLVLAAVAGIIAFSIQISWLISDETSLNWTIPKIHYFNFAGWYHAFFFIFIIILITVLTTNMFFTDKTYSESNSKSRIISEFLIWFCGSLFVNLHIIDDYHKKNTLVILITVNTVVFFFVFTLFKFFSLNRKLKLNSIAVCWLAVILSYFISNLYVFQYLFVDVNFLIILSSLFFCVMFIVPAIKYEKVMTKIFLMMSFTIVPLQYLIINSNSFSSFVVNLLFILISSIVIALSQLELCRHTIKIKAKDTGKKVDFSYKITKRDVVSYLFMGMLAQLSIALIGFLSKGISNYSDILNNLLSIVTSIMIPPYIRRTFRNVIESENHEEKIVSSRWRIVTYSLYLLLFIGSISIIIYSLCKSIKNTINNTYNANFINISSIIIVLFALIFGAYLCASNKSKNRISAVTTIILGFFAYFSVVLLNVFSNNLLIDLRYMFDYRVIIMMISALAFSFIVSYGFYNNKIYLRKREFDFISLCESIVILIGTLAVCMTNIIYLTIWLSVGNIIIFICSVFVVSLVIPFIFCNNDFAVPQEKNNLLKNKAKEGVLQDGFLYGIATIICQLLTISLLPSKFSVNLNDFFVPILSAFLFSSVLVGPIDLCISNNLKHYSDRNSEFNNDSQHYSHKQIEEAWWLMKLKHYLSVQNIVTLFVIFPYSIVTMFSFVIKCASNKDIHLKNIILPNEKQ